MSSTDAFAPTFALIDTDQDGYITVSEFGRMLNMLGEWRVGDDIAASMFAQIDTDADGKASLEELAVYLSTPANQPTDAADQPSDSQD